jgi:hypothetical protein
MAQATVRRDRSGFETPISAQTTPNTETIGNLAVERIDPSMGAQS